MNLAYRSTPNPVELPASLVDGVMQRLVAHIRGRGLRPGDGLPSEGAFALETGVSRAVVREAFRAMATLRLIDIGNGRRPRVAAIDRSVVALVLDHAVATEQTSIQQVFDVRRAVELRTVSLAALRRSDAEAGRIAALAEAMRLDFTAPGQVMEHDIAFHEAIAETSRNPLFALLVGSFSAITRQTWAIAWAARPEDAQRRASVECHRAIAAAIAARDHRLAEAAMTEHFDGSVRALLAAGIT